MKLFNSLTKTKETFEPIKDNYVGIYTCGPTVYSYVSIGNWRTYVLGDVVVRSLTFLGYDVDYVMNITDVGHLTGDNEGDADTGDDRLEKAAKKEGKTAWDIAQFYADDFLEGYHKLNLTQPNLFAKATDHIKEQIDMVKAIEQAGFAYKIDDGIYFDVKAYESAGNTYGQLSNIDQVKAGARVEANPAKRDPRDFALWKFSNSHKLQVTSDKIEDSNYPERQMNWWYEGKLMGKVVNKNDWENIKKEHPEILTSVGFPGWHIECSAMSTKYLGDQFDIHIGGEDLRSTHHPNEIAQAEACTGKIPFVKYWIHGAFLTVDGGRMGKSLGNAYTLQDLEAKGFSATDLKYFYYSGHYRKPLNFTWEALESAQQGLSNLKHKIASLNQSQESGVKSKESVSSYLNRFKQAISDDLNMPEALSVVWNTIKDAQLADDQKVSLVKEFDQVLGLNLFSNQAEDDFAIDPDIQVLLDQRNQARTDKNFELADQLRNQIHKAGYEIEDTQEGSRLVKI